MGNSLHGVSLLSGGNFENYHSQMGKNASIDVTRVDNIETDPGTGLLVVIRNWIVLYTIKGSKCKLDLKCDVTAGDKINTTWFEVDDDLLPNCDKFTINKTKSDLLKLYGPWYSPPIRRRMPNDFTYRRETRRPSSTTLDGVVETNIFVYGRETKGGLLVFESEKKNGDQNPYLLTLAHYYASDGNFFDYYNRTNIGLSLIAKFRTSNDTGFEITVEGPTQHRAIALLYMFDEVIKTGIWKPTTCPYCPNIQKQSANGHAMSSQSDTDQDNNGLGQAAKIIANNRSMFKGILSGSFIKVIIGKK